MGLDAAYWDSRGGLGFSSGSGMVLVEADGIHQLERGVMSLGGLGPGTRLLLPVGYDALVGDCVGPILV